MIYPCGTKAVPSVNQVHLLCNTGKHQCRCRGSIASAYNRNGFTPVEHGVTGGTVAYATSHQCFFPLYTQVAVGCTGGNDHRPCLKHRTGGFHLFQCACQVYSFYFAVFRFYPKSSRTGLHLHPQGNAVHPIGEAGVIVNLGGLCHLSAGGDFLNHQRAITGTGSIQRSGVARRTTANHNHVIASVHRKVSLTNPAFQAAAAWA